MELPAHPNQNILIERVDGDRAALRRLIIDAINEQGSVHAAAKSLGVRHAALNYWRKRLGIVVETTTVAREKSA